MFRRVLQRSSSSALSVRVVQRHINIHEYQSKELMAKHNVAVQAFRVCEAGATYTPEQAAKELNLAAGREYVVKAQVHAGGRGKGHFRETGYKGGVQVVRSVDAAAAATRAMLGKHLVTKQTPPDGVLVRKVMIAEALDIKKEYYFAILMDRSFGGPVLVASPDGGMDIEAVAEKTPERIYKEAVDIKTGLKPGQTEALARKLGFDPKLTAQAAKQMENLYNLFLATDATQVEINPLVETPDGRVVSFDAKISFDDNALFRQPAVQAMHDPSEEDPRDVEAAKYSLNYVAMDGEIGCMVNGAGLAMATMDIISHYGASPANFLDVGGGATQENVEAAFRLLRSDPKVKAILVNIFGGIMKCDVIANGVVGAAKSMKLDIPLVVRLEGTNVELGKKILRESGINVITADNLDDAAQKAVASLKKSKQSKSK
jgi:succinyl-CoA synthetase beta subunit